VNEAWFALPYCPVAVVLLTFCGECHGVSNKFNTMTPMKTISRIVTQFIGWDISFQFNIGYPLRCLLLCLYRFYACHYGFQNEKAARSHKKNGDPIGGRP
jgi:hypothetical protein